MFWLFVVLAVLCFLALLAYPFWLYWRYVLSIKKVERNQRGVRKNWGELETEMCSVPGKTVQEEGVVFLPPGKYFRPWIPDWVYGYQPYDLVLIPTDTFKVPWDKSDLEDFWTADAIQIEQVQVNAMQSLPWKDPVAMLWALRANVPMQVKDYPDGREGLQSWEEQSVMSEVRIAIRTQAHDYFTGKFEKGVMTVKPDPKFIGVTKMVNNALRDKDHPFFQAGLFGMDPDDNTPGMGYLKISIEAVKVEKDFQKKLQEKVTSVMDVEISEQKAKASAALLDNTNQALKTWLDSHPDATPEQIAKKQQELALRAYLAAGGQNMEIHGLENASTAVVGGGAGAGILVGNQGGSKGGKGGERKKVSDMTPEELSEESGLKAP